MRISDWSSDVCSSDLAIIGPPEGEGFRLHLGDEACCLRPFPRPFVTARAGAARDPPALPRYAVALPDDEHRQLRLASRCLQLVDRAQEGAKSSEARRVGKAGVRTCRSGGWPYQ